MGEKFKENIDAVRKNRGMIYCMIVFSIITSVLVTSFMSTPVYQSSAQLLVNQPQQENYRINKYDIQDNIKAIATYGNIVKSRVVLEKVKKQLGLDYSIRDLNENISVEHMEKSQVFEITVRDGNPETAALIANKTAEIFQQEVTERMNAGHVSLLNPALKTANPKQVERNPVANAAISAFFALSAGVGIAMILPKIDSTIKTEEDVEHFLETPVLGNISRIPPGGSGNVIRFPSARKKIVP